MNTELSEAIGARLLRFGMQSFLRSASLFQQRTTPTLTLTNRPRLWLCIYYIFYLYGYALLSWRAREYACIAVFLSGLRVQQNADTCTFCELTDQLMFRPFEFLTETLFM